MLCQSDDVPWAPHEHGNIRAERRRLGAAAGARDIGLSRYRIAPGAQAMALRVHADEEEISSCSPGRASAGRTTRCTTSGPATSSSTGRPPRRTR